MVDYRQEEVKRWSQRKSSVAVAKHGLKSYSNVLHAKGICAKDTLPTGFALDAGEKRQGSEKGNNKEVKPMECTRCGCELTPDNTLHGMGGQVKWCDFCWAVYWKVELDMGFPCANIKRTQAMCSDLESACLNCKRIERGDTDQYYAQQAHAVAQWKLGGTAPDSIVFGELPYAGKVGRSYNQEE